MKLVIVESPTKAKTLTRFLGSDYHVMASMGHIRDLPEKKLGIDTKKNFELTYEVSVKKKDTVKELQSQAKKADQIILATDPDREGEAIAWHIASILDGDSEGKKKKTKKELLRVTFHEITESAIKDAIGHPGTINMQLVDAQQARRVLDRLVGYKLSPLLWRKVRKGLSAGRVQSVAVRLIVEREREITAFKAVEYWDILARLAKAGAKPGTEFEAKLAKIDGQNFEIGTKEQSEVILRDLQASEFKVSDLISKQVRRSPYPPFTTSTLQQTASNVFGWSAKKTMQVAQNLYERGFITYHRTDSTNLAIEAVTTVRDFIGSKYGKEFLPENPRLFKTKSKVAQEAHEAIRPTAADNLEERLASSGLDHDQARLYSLIWKRFVATQMNEAIYDQKTIEITAAKYLFRTTGSKAIFLGWQILFKEDKKEEEIDPEAEEANKVQELPDLAIGEVVDLKEILPTQHFTMPPPRFTEASIIKVLEEYGIGRPSTYAPIISTIQDRQYVEKVEKKFQPTNLGYAVNDFLMANFPKLFEYSFTAQMEDELDAVANGEKEWKPVIREFFDPFEELLTSVTANAERVKVEVEETDEVCPNDGAPLVVRIGKFGKFLACSKFPDCKFTKQFQQKLQIKCPKCEVGDVIIKRTKTKKSFFGCSRYPECDFASWTKPKVEAAPVVGEAEKTPQTV
jgi:DNA topoisomerase-1